MSLQGFKPYRFAHIGLTAATLYSFFGALRDCERTRAININDRFAADLFPKKSNIILFYILKVLHGAVLQLITGRVVADYDALRVHLQHADRPHLADTAFDGMGQGAGLAVAVGQDHHLATVHDCTYTHRQSGLRHLVDVVLEEA